MTKFKVQSRATSCAWTNDGQYFAVGLFTGLVSIRNKVSWPLGENCVSMKYGHHWNPFLPLCTISVLLYIIHICTYVVLVHCGVYCRVAK